MYIAKAPSATSSGRTTRALFSLKGVHKEVVFIPSRRRRRRRRPQYPRASPSGAPPRPRRRPPSRASSASSRTPPFWASQKLIIPVNIAPIEDLIALLSRNPTVLDKLSVCTVSPHNDITPKAKMTSRKNEEICAYRF